MTIVSIDFDAFYVGCHRSVDPSVRGIPFAVQQKHILCTVSYEARARGVKKLGSISDARKICPEIQTVNGEDLTLYRTISRNVFAFLSDYLGKDTPIQKLGLDEYFIDITNLPAQPRELSKQTHLVYQDNEPTDAELNDMAVVEDIRRQIHSRFHLTCSAGISNSIMLSKLVGNLHKPDHQTLLNVRSDGDLQAFLDPFPLRKLHGFGRVIVERMARMLGTEDEDSLTVRNARTQLSRPDLEREFGERVGARLYQNLRGIDNEEVKQSDIYPRQISIEDSSGNIDAVEDAWRMLESVTERLIRRLDEEYVDVEAGSGKRVFKLHPTRVRISTRRTSTIANTRVATHVPESLSSAVGVSLFHLDKYSKEERARRLCKESLYSMVKRLYDAGIAHHANKLRVVNVAFTDFADGPPPPPIDQFLASRAGKASKKHKKNTEIVYLSSSSSSSNDGDVEVENEDVAAYSDADADADEDAITCPVCHAQLMTFTVESHMRFHDLGND